MNFKLTRIVTPPQRSTLGVRHYQRFMAEACKAFAQFPQYLTTGEDVNALELAHLVPDVPETILAIYLGINDAACNKGLISPFLVRHGHHTVFAFDPNVWSGGSDIPKGTIEVRKILPDFQPPNASWPKSWTYVMIADKGLTVEAMWKTKGYIDTIPAKFEDFTVLTDSAKTPICTFVDRAVFEHPVNKSRAYLKAARNRGQKMAADFTVPKGLEGETKGLAPVVLNKGEKLYIARTDFKAAEHCWSNIHPKAEGYAVINENSAVPLNLVINKPPVSPKYAKKLAPVLGSADMTTDWFLRGARVSRAPILQGTFKG